MARTEGGSDRQTYDEELAHVLLDAEISDQHRRTAQLWARLLPAETPRRPDAA